MADTPSRKLVVILHADVVGSTQLVQTNESVAHDRIQDTYHRFSATIEAYNGITRELRGDALVAEFARASDAVSAALLFQTENSDFNARLGDAIQPRLRIGISLGEVVVADNTVTGAGVVLAQRLEQLADSDGVVVQATVSETVPTRLPFEFKNLGEQSLKGFQQPVRAFVASLAPGKSVPKPEKIREALPSSTLRGTRRKVQAMMVVIGLIAIGGLFAWHATREVDVLKLPTGPHIAVMTFTNIGNEEEEYFSVGLSEDLVSALSKFSEFVVLPRQAKNSFESESAACQEVGDTLGAHYVLDGTVRRSEQTLRITAKLLDTGDCTRRWSETFDRSLTADDVFAIQDEITSRVVASIGSYLTRLLSGSKLKELQGNRTESLEAYGCVLLGSYWAETFSEEVHKRAQDCLERAVEIDPNYSMAEAGLGSAYINAHKYNYSHTPSDALDLAEAHIQKAIELNPRNQLAYWALAIHHNLTELDLELFYSAADEAIAINPNNALVLADLGTWIAYSGEWGSEATHL